MITIQNIENQGSKLHNRIPKTSNSKFKFQLTYSNVAPMAIHIQMMVHDKRRLNQTASMIVQWQLMCHRIAYIRHCHWLFLVLLVSKSPFSLFQFIRFHLNRWMITVFVWFLTTLNWWLQWMCGAAQIWYHKFPNFGLIIQK